MAVAAWAMARDIAARVRAFTLFATHYFELTTLAMKSTGAQRALDATSTATASYSCTREGRARQSQLWPAGGPQLAGVPLSVIPRHAHLEAYGVATDRERASANGRDGPRRKRNCRCSLPPRRRLNARPRRMIRAALASLDPDELSPKAALEVLYRLRRLLDAARRG